MGSTESTQNLSAQRWPLSGVKENHVIMRLYIVACLYPRAIYDLVAIENCLETTLFSVVITVRN